MSASIGKGSLVLTANAKPLAGDLNGAHSKITAWSSKVNASVSKVGGGGGGMFANIKSGLAGLSNSAGGLLSGLAGLGGGAGGVLGMLGKIGGPAIVATAALVATKVAVDKVTEGLERLANVGKQARTLGVDPSTFAGLGAAAQRQGVELAEFGNIIAKMQSKIATGGPEIDHALQSIGLSVNQLQGMGGTGAFMSIATGLSQTHDSGLRAAAAMKIFEENGLKLMPMLQKGEAGLRAFIESQRATGAVLSNEGMASAEKAGQAVTNASQKIESALTGVWNRILVAVSPIVERIANAISSAMDALQPVFDWMGRAADAMGGGLSILADESLIALGSIGEGVSELLGMFGDFGIQLPSIGEVITFALQGIGNAGAYAFDTLKAGVGAVQLGLSGLVDLFGLIARGIENLMDVAMKLPESLGGGKDGLFAQGSAIAAETRAKFENEAKAMRESAIKKITDFGGTADRLNGKFADQKKKGEKGPETKTKAEEAIGSVASVLANVDKAVKAKTDNVAIFKGSKEDYSLRVGFNSGKMDKDKAQLDEAKKATDQLKEVNKNLGKMMNKETPSTMLFEF